MMDIAGVTAPHDVFRSFHHWRARLLRKSATITVNGTLLGTNISPTKAILEKMIFLFPRWDMLVSWSVFLVWYFDKNADIFTPSFTINDGLKPDLEDLVELMSW